MIQGKQTIAIFTKKDKNEKVGKKTTLTVVWDGASEDGVKALALQALVVKLQGSFRNKGIPEALTVQVKDNLPGVRHQMTAEEAFASLSEKERADLVAKYQKKPEAKAA